MGVSEAASRLGVASSTAHRLFAMLVYRDFAEQGPDRLYRPGPSLRASSSPEAPVVHLRRAAHPHLEQLVKAVNESANLLVLSGADVRFVSTVECTQALRVGDRTGKAMLAQVDEEQRSAVLSTMDEADRRLVRRGVSAVRRNGFAVNNQGPAKGLAAVDGRAGTAPQARGGGSPSQSRRLGSTGKIDGWVRRMTECVDGIEHSL
jgi:DNA-binding IclR family transcriptional regulator